MSDYGVEPENIRDAAFGVTIPPGATVDAQLEKLISKAEMLLPGACIERGLDAGTITAEQVVSVVEDMVVRVTKNASGFRQRSIDDYSVTIDTSLSSGSLYLSDHERDRLCPPDRARGRMGTIAIGIPTYRLPGHGV